MSEQLKYRMQTFEMAPPAQAWEAIAVRLDDDSNYAVLSQKIHSYESAPPVTAWELIALRLNDDTKHAGLSKKMNSYEVTPPAGTWNKIAGLLDGFSEGRTRSVIPDTKVLPIRSWYKMAAAAVIAVLLAGAAWYFISQQSSLLPNNSIAKENQPTPAINENSQKTTGNEQVPPVISPDSPLPDVKDLVVGDNKERVNAINSSPVNNGTRNTNTRNEYVLTYTKVNRPPSYLEQPIVINAPVLLDETGRPYRDINVLTTNSSYLTIAGPNGELTRISAKFANIIQFLDGSSDDQLEENIDKILRESSIWKERFQQWRNKIKKSGYLPASGNFLDILEFKELIEEK
jgi:hypothetical protein